MVRKKKLKAPASHPENQASTSQDIIVPSTAAGENDENKPPPRNQSHKDDTAREPPAKKAKRNHVGQLPNAGNALSSHPSEAVAVSKVAEKSKTTNNQPSPSEIPSEVLHLASKYDFTPMSVTSSSKIEQKTRNVLDRVSRFSFANVTGKPGVVILHCPAKCANKLVSIAEVAKRQIEKEKGTWWQYTKLDSQVMELKLRQHKSGVEPAGKTLAAWEAEQVGKASTDAGADVEMGEHPTDSATIDHVDDSGEIGVAGEKADGEEEDEEEGEGFETMEVPATEPMVTDSTDNGRKKVRAVPMVTIYLAKVPLPGLKELYGEQTNSPAS